MRFLADPKAAEVKFKSNSLILSQNALSLKAVKSVGYQTFDVIENAADRRN